MNKRSIGLSAVALSIIFNLWGCKGELSASSDAKDPSTRENQTGTSEVDVTDSATQESQTSTTDGGGSDGDTKGSGSGGTKGSDELSGDSTSPETPGAENKLPCGEIAHGDYATRNRFQTELVPFGSLCVSEIQTALCNNGLLGSWTGTFENDACTIDSIHTPQVENHAPTFTSNPGTQFVLPQLDLNSRRGNVTPEAIDVVLTAGQEEDFSVSISLPAEEMVVTTADVFLLLLDTGGYAGTSPSVIAAFTQLITDLVSNVPGVDFGFGVGRYEEYGGQYWEDMTGRPFILNHPIIASSTTGFGDAINGALNRDGPGYGGDGPAPAFEALLQIATGSGFDGNLDSNLMGSGAAGLVSTMTTPGNSGDVPPFSSYTADAVGGTLAPSGSLGGAGFRPGALPVVILATDVASAYRPVVPEEQVIVGKNGVTVPITKFKGTTSRADAPAGGATIQETVDALNDLGAVVIGVGKDYGDPDPRQFLEALSKLTHSVNQSAQDIDSGILNDPIGPGEPFYFDVWGQGSTPVAGIREAIRNAVIHAPFALDVQGTPPGAMTNVTGVKQGIKAGTTNTFNIKLTGDGLARTFDADFSGNFKSLGSLPIRIRVPYEYDVNATDEDGDTLTYSLVEPTHGASIDAQTGLLRWTPDNTGQFSFVVEVHDGKGASTQQSWTIDVTTGP